MFSDTSENNSKKKHLYLLKILKITNQARLDPYLRNITSNSTEFRIVVQPYFA